jgi:hypothetical protein
MCCLVLLYAHTTMLDSVFVINNLKDMEKVEDRLSHLTHGERGRCNILRSADYQKFRLAAVYKKHDKMELSKPPLRMTLDGDVVTIFLKMNDGIEYIDDITDLNKKKRRRRVRKDSCDKVAVDDDDDDDDVMDEH